MDTEYDGQGKEIKPAAIIKPVAAVIYLFSLLRDSGKKGIF